MDVSSIIENLDTEEITKLLEMVFCLQDPNSRGKEEQVLI